MKLLKKYPFFLILLVVFFCLHGGVENYYSISFEEVFFVGISILIAISVLFLICFFFTRNVLFASLITLFIGVWYFFFGAIHDFIKSIRYLSIIESYSVLLPLLIVATICWIIFLKDQKSLWQKLASYLNILLLLYCVIDFAIITYYSISHKKKITPQDFNYKNVKNKPDVYFLLFDGYPGQKSLRDSFNFDNVQFQTFLKANNFVNLPITSNYDLTVFSMSSTLNMCYIKNDWNLPKPNQKDVQKRMNEIKEATVFNYFLKMGYAIHNNSIFDIQNTPGISNENSFLLGHSVLLTDKILFNRLNRDIGAAIPEKISKRLPFLRDQSFFRHRQDNENIETMLLNNLAKSKQNTPVFSYSHFLLPHGPYYFDSSGTAISYKEANEENAWANRSNFISYLKYSNKVAEEIIIAIRKKRPQAIIIFMSDHGFRYFNDDLKFQPARFNNTCNVYFPDNNYGNISEKLTNVNFYSYLFNNQFGQRIKFLGDTCIGLNYGH